MEPLPDDTAICPACNGSGFSVADTYCGYCGGCGGVPLEAAQRWDNERRRWESPAIAKATQP